MKNNLAIILFWFLFTTVCQSSYGQYVPLANYANQALPNYINKADSSFKWKEYQKSQISDGTYYELSFTSQAWQELAWQHKLMVYFPAKARYPGTMVINLMHGHYYDRDADMESLKYVSDSTGTAAAMLYDIPNQPLFDGREEDDLQAYTFSQYIRTGDESWPLLFPMVKSVVRAMDVVQHLARKEKLSAVDDFLLAGHSKRGHTSWLTAAVDKRVKGIIPIAIDILNSKAQLPHHLEAFGQYHTPSKATTDFLQELQQPGGQSLIQMIDAYTFREQLTLPKLIVSATNDNFFATDALNLYWDGLKGPKWVLYLPNASHVSAYSDPRANATAFAFIRAVAGHKSLPEMKWQYNRKGNAIVLTIKVGLAANKALLWTSVSDTKDFRKAVWKSQPMKFKSDEEYMIEVNIPEKGHFAIYGEVEFVEDGRTFRLSTQTNISSAKK